MRGHSIKIRKISMRITLYFSALLVAIALVISILNISIYSGELSNEMDNVVQQKLSLISGRLSENINSIILIHTVMLSDHSIKTAFKNVVEDPSPTNIQLLSILIDNHHSTGSNNIDVISLGANGELYNPNPNFPAFKRLTQDNADFALVQEKSQYLRFTTPNTFKLEHLDPSMQQRNNITLYGQFYDYDSMKLLGYLAINFAKTELFDEITPLATETFAATFIVNEFDELIFQTGDIAYEVLPPNLENNTTIKLNKKNYSVLTGHLESYERWRIITLFDRDQIANETNRLNFFIFLVLGVSLVIMFFISWAISQSITNPIRELVSSMAEFEEGQWPEPLETENEDEIKDLIDGYNTMLTSFIKLTDDIIGRQQENQMIELDLINTQLGLLEAQINPHFIHNTLNSMNYLALSKGNQELSKVIESFNKLLRMSMAIDVGFVTVAQEIQNIKDYAMIQKVRFEDVFTVEYDVDEDVSIAKMPKLILQPVVENSIIHGILPKEDGGHITIRIKRMDDDLRISILDDGVGIDPEALSQMVKKDKKGYISKHIGVQNVYDRLKLYYGEDINFTINSTPNQGTVTTLVIPYED